MAEIERRFTGLNYNEKYIFIGRIGRIRAVFDRRLPEGSSIMKGRLCMLAGKQYYFSVLFCMEIAEPEQIPYISEGNSINRERSVGLDFSLPYLYVDSNGDKGGFCNYYRMSEKKIIREQKKLACMKQYSENYIKCKNRIAMLHEKIVRQRKDFLHKKANNLLSRYDLICIENLDLKKIAHRNFYGRELYDRGWNEFTEILKYKGETEGKVVIRVDRFFPSSQKCSICGSINRKLKNVHIRKWMCPECGNLLDRDVNAAVNIREEGIRILENKMVQKDKF